MCIQVVGKRHGGREALDEHVQWEGINGRTTRVQQIALYPNMQHQKKRVCMQTVGFFIVEERPQISIYNQVGWLAR